MRITLSALIPVVLAILCVAVMIVMPILTLVNQHRVRNGKEPLNKGKVRNIVIVNKRAAEHEFFTERYAYSRFGNVRTTGEPDGIAQETSVDFHIVGGKILYTKSIGGELFDIIDVGKTYKVLIRSGCIEKIFTDQANT